MEEKIYQVGDRILSITSSEEKEFLTDFPDAVEVKTFQAEGKKFRVAVDEVGDFLGDFPDATELFGMEQKALEVTDFASFKNALSNKQSVTLPATDFAQKTELEGNFLQRVFGIKGTKTTPIKEYRFEPNGTGGGSVIAIDEEGEETEVDEYRDQEELEFRVWTDMTKPVIDPMTQEPVTDSDGDTGLISFNGETKVKSRADLQGPGLSERPKNVFEYTAEVMQMGSEQGRGAATLQWADFMFGGKEGGEVTDKQMQVMIESAKKQQELAAELEKFDGFISDDTENTLLKGLNAVEDFIGQQTQVILTSLTGAISAGIRNEEGEISLNNNLVKGIIEGAATGAAAGGTLGTAAGPAGTLAGTGAGALSGSGLGFSAGMVTSFMDVNFQSKVFERATKFAIEAGKDPSDPTVLREVFEDPDFRKNIDDAMWATSALFLWEAIGGGLTRGLSPWKEIAAEGVVGAGGELNQQLVSISNGIQDAVDWKAVGQEVAPAAVTGPISLASGTPALNAANDATPIFKRRRENITKDLMVEAAIQDNTKAFNDGVDLYGEVTNSDPQAIEALKENMQEIQDIANSVPEDVVNSKVKRREIVQHIIDRNAIDSQIEVLENRSRQSDETIRPQLQNEIGRLQKKRETINQSVESLIDNNNIKDTPKGEKNYEKKNELVNFMKNKGIGVTRAEVDVKGNTVTFKGLKDQNLSDAEVQNIANSVKALNPEYDIKGLPKLEASTTNPNVESIEAPTVDSPSVPAEQRTVPTPLKVDDVKVGDQFKIGETNYEVDSITDDKFNFKEVDGEGILDAGKDDIIQRANDPNNTNVISQTPQTPQETTNQLEDISSPEEAAQGSSQIRTEPVESIDEISPGQQLEYEGNPDHTVTEINPDNNTVSLQDNVTNEVIQNIPVTKVNNVIDEGQTQTDVRQDPQEVSTDQGESTSDNSEVSQFDPELDPFEQAKTENINLVRKFFNLDESKATPETVTQWEQQAKDRFISKDRGDTTLEDQLVINYLQGQRSEPAHQIALANAINRIVTQLRVKREELTAAKAKKRILPSSNIQHLQEGISHLEYKLDLYTDVLRRMGTDGGRGLAVRKEILNIDALGMYSEPRLRTRLKEALGLENLSNTDSKYLANKAKEIADLKKRVEKAISNRNKDIARNSKLAENRIFNNMVGTKLTKSLADAKDALLGFLQGKGCD